MSEALHPTDSGWCARFDAMASPCEVLIDGGDAALARRLHGLARDEALRIEHKFSRYRDDSVIGRLHAHAAAHPGQPFEVDEETAALLDLAAQCHALSDGRFDITSGVLRRVWRFDGSDRVPDAAAVQAVCRDIGWARVRWQRPAITLPGGMELDLGGIGKEYAVDRVLGLLRQHSDRPLLVNFGGDLAVSGPRADGRPWHVGIERPPPQAGTSGAQAAASGAHVGRSADPATDRSAGRGLMPDAAGLLAVRAGGIATSGDARRFLLKDGVRYGHILDPRTGWPVRDAPRSVTVAAPTCTEAGLLATLAMLQGPDAEALLAAQGLPYWVWRDPAG